MNKRIVALGIGLVLVVAVQFTMIGSMRSELRAVRAQLSELTGTEREVERDSADEHVTIARPSFSGLGDLQTRLARVEQSVGELVDATERLRERGALPLTADNLQSYKDRFADASLSEADRMRALRMLRRNRAITDEVVLSAIDLLRTSTNANTRRELVQNMDGSTNAAMKQPLLSMLEAESSSRVREEIVDTLSDFARTDPAVSGKLWELALNDPDRGVREEALQELARGELNDQLVTALRQQATSGETSLEDQLLAFRTLRQANVDVGDLNAQMVQLAQTAEDPLVRARIFREFDGVADDSLKAPLVYGLQDPNPVVREQAADALGRFAASDPQVREWLTYVSQNDADPVVQREAHRALEQSNRRGRGR